MSIKKYTTFESAEKDLWMLKPDKGYFKGVFALLRMNLFKKDLKCPTGIFKYKTIEEAQKDAEQWLK